MVSEPLFSIYAVDSEDVEEEDDDEEHETLKITRVSKSPESSDRFSIALNYILCLKMIKFSP